MGLEDKTTAILVNTPHIMIQLARNARERQKHASPQTLYQRLESYIHNIYNNFTKRYF